MAKQKLSGGMKILGAIVYVLVIIMGICLFFHHLWIVELFSLAAIVYGLMLIIKYFGKKESRRLGDIVSGLISLAFGLIMFFGAASTKVYGLLAIETFVAIWSLFAGMMHIWGSIEMKKIEVKTWCWVLTGGILMVVCGAAFLVMPLIGIITLVNVASIYAGIAFILAGATGLTDTLSH